MPGHLLALAFGSLTLTAATSAQTTDHVDSIMQRYAGSVPGASLLVLKNGKTIVRRSYGMADLEAGTKATPATNYRLASVTKQFTAAAILLLVQDHKLSLADPVRRWLPSRPKDGSFEPFTSGSAPRGPLRRHSPGSVLHG